MAETKTEMLHIRISPLYKKYLEKWATEAGMSIGSLINKWIKFRKFEEIDIIARKEAHQKASEIFGIPFKMVSGITTAEDWKGFANLIGEEKYNAYYKEWWIFFNDAQDKICEKEGFNWDSDKSTDSVDE